jgi:hypothetical protein
MPTAVRFLGGEPIYVDVVPLGINSNLTVVGVTGSHGYIQTATAVYTLFDCPGDNIWGTQLVAINDQGIMLGYWQDTNYAWHPFWTNGFGCTALPEVPGAKSTGWGGINNHNQIVGGYTETDGTSTHGLLDDDLRDDTTLPEQVSRLPMQSSLCS